MFSTNPSSTQESKTKGQTKQPCSNHMKQLSLQNTTGKKRVSKTESMSAASHRAIPLQLPGACQQWFYYIFPFVFKVSQHQHWCCRITSQWLHSFSGGLEDPFKLGQMTKVRLLVGQCEVVTGPEANFVVRLREPIQHFKLEFGKRYGIWTCV